MLHTLTAKASEIQLSLKSMLNLVVLLANFCSFRKRNHDVTWLKDGTALSPRGLVRGVGQINTSPGGASIGGYLVLRNVSIRDEGNYSCRVESQLHKRTLVSTSNRIAIRVQCKYVERWESMRMQYVHQFI